MSLRSIGRGEIYFGTSSISQHRYSAAFCSGGDFALSSFLSKTNVRGNLTLWKPDIAASKQRGLRYILGYVNKIGSPRIVTDTVFRETGSIACHGAPGVSNTAGASLWVSDYALQAASLGIEETFFHEGIGYKYNFVSVFSSLSSFLSLACSMVSFTVPTN